MISNLEYYRTFYAVANYLHFSRAAEYLCVSQSAVSQAIHKLEAELGCILFDRSGKSLRLTPEGEVLQQHISKAMQEIHIGETQVQKVAQMNTGELLIGATETAIRFHLAGKIHDFSKSHPGIRIAFSGSTTEDLCRKLQNGEIEIAFLISPVPAGYDFDLIHLQDIQDLPVAATDFPVDKDRVYTPSDLAQHPLISVTSDNMVRSVIDEWFLEDNTILAADYTVRTMSQILPLVQQGLGIGIIAEDFVRDDLQQNRLVRLKTTSLPKKRSLYIVTNTNISVPAAGKDFIDMFLVT